MFSFYIVVPEFLKPFAGLPLITVILRAFYLPLILIIILFVWKILSQAKDKSEALAQFIPTIMISIGSKRE